MRPIRGMVWGCALMMLAAGTAPTRAGWGDCRLCCDGCPRPTAYYAPPPEVVTPCYEPPPCPPRCGPIRRLLHRCCRVPVCTCRPACACPAPCPAPVCPAPAAAVVPPPPAASFGTPVPLPSNPPPSNYSPPPAADLRLSPVPGASDLRGDTPPPPPAPPVTGSSYRPTRPVAPVAPRPLTPPLPPPPVHLGRFVSRPVGE